MRLDIEDRGAPQGSKGPVKKNEYVAPMEEDFRVDQEDRGSRESDMSGFTPPDGGWGWVVVFCSFMIHVIVDGIVYTFGIFYLELLNYFGASKAATSWVASIMVGTTFCIGPIASALTNRFGCRVVTILGAIIAASGFILSIAAPSIYFLYLSVGLIGGSGFGLIYLPAVVCVTCYFEKKRAFATGIAVCGAGMGTFILAPLVNFLVATYTWKGAMLIIAGLILNCCIFGGLFRPLQVFKPSSSRVTEVLLHHPEKDDSSWEVNGDGAKILGNSGLVKTPLLVVQKNDDEPSSENPDLQDIPSPNQLGVLYRKDIFYSGSLLNIPEYKSNPNIYKSSNLSINNLSATNLKRRASRLSGVSKFPKEMKDAFVNMLDLEILRNPIFLLFGISNFLTNIGFNVPYIYIKHRGTSIGIDENDASYFIGAIGISSTIGRIILGYLSDRTWVNRLWLYNTSLVINGAVTALSFYCKDYDSMMGYSVIFGFTAGTYVSLTSVVLVDLLGLDKLTNAFGLLLVFEGSACLIGPPITGWLYDVTGSYDLGFVVSGVTIALSGLILYCIPWVQRQTQNQNGGEKKNPTITSTIV